MALIVALAFKDAGAEVGEGVLVDAENAAYDACRLSPDELRTLGTAEASLLREEARGSKSWSEDDFDDNYTAHRARLEESLVARLEGCEHAREAAENVASSLASWIYYNSEAHYARARREMRERKRLLAICRHHARRRPARKVAPVAPLEMAKAEAGALLDRVPAHVDLDSEPGVLGHLARWSLSSAFRPVREFALPSALAVLATVFGRRFVTPTGAGLNLYMVALAGTGVGKEDLLKAPQTILGKANLGHLLGPGDFTSDSAIEATVPRPPIGVRSHG